MYSFSATTCACRWCSAWSYGQSIDAMHFPSCSTWPNSGQKQPRWQLLVHGTIGCSHVPWHPPQLLYTSPSPHSAINRTTYKTSTPGMYMYTYTYSTGKCTCRCCTFLGLGVSGTDKISSHHNNEKHHSLHLFDSLTSDFQSKVFKMLC